METKSKIITVIVSLICMTHCAAQPIVIPVSYTHLDVYKRQGSAAIASHMALDFWKNANVKAVAFNDASLLTALANDYSYAEVFSKSIEVFGDAGDALMAISASGNSQNIVNAAVSAKQKDIDVITFSGFSLDNKLKQQGAINFYVPSESYGLVETAHAYRCV